MTEQRYAEKEIYIIVTDDGQIIASHEDEDVWRDLEFIHGYSALQQYQLTVKLPCPPACIDLAAALDGEQPRSTDPVTLTISREHNPSNVPSKEDDA